eukprot:7541958-Prorocentrum_lima.AAC.1
MVLLGIWLLYQDQYCRQSLWMNAFLLMALTSSGITWPNTSRSSTRWQFSPYGINPLLLLAIVHLHQGPR